MMRRLHKVFLLSCLSMSSLGHAAPHIKRDGDFKDLVTQSTVFADKSLLIKDVIEDGDTTLLLAMPRRWGKTVNLDMLRRFLEIPVDGHGKLLDATARQATDNYKLFAGGQVNAGIQGEVELSPLRIANAKLFDNVDALRVQGSYPVIYIDFKNCKSDDYETVKQRIRSTLSKSFRHHSYLKASSKLTNHQRTLIDQYIEVSNEPSIAEGLEMLSDALYHHHQKKVWILVDEYDAVANVAYRAFDDHDLKATINLFSSIYEAAFKSNPYLEKGVLTGVQYIAQSGMLSGLNNLGKFDFTSAKYAQHYGLDQGEVDLFFHHFKVPAALADKAKQWYDGYKVPRYLSNIATNQPSEVIAKYNVWSIISYLKEGEFYAFKSYWERSGHIDFFDALFTKPEVRAHVEQLVNGESISLVRIADFSVENFKTLKEMRGGNKAMTPDGLKVLFSYLFIGGYLTIDGTTSNRYRLPNMEITHEMGNRLITYYETLHTVDRDTIQCVTNVLQQVMDVEIASSTRLSTLLQDFYHQFREVIRSLQLVNANSEEGVLTNEDIVHSILNYIALQTQHTTLGSEVYTKKLHSGKKGRVDLKMTKGNVGMIMEVKCVPTNQGHMQHMEATLAQAKSYRNVLTTSNNIFLAINVAKQASVPEARAIELLCEAELYGGDYMIAIDVEGRLTTSHKKRRIS